MNTPVNLNRVRKSRARADKAAKACENAVKFGRSKAAKQAEAQAQDKARREIEAHKRER